MLVAASFLTTGFAVVTAPSAAATALPITLHFRSTTGFGNVDAALVGGSFLSTEASPFTFPPAVWHSIPVIGSTVADGPFDAFWTWEPAGGYSFSDVSGQVVFSATSPANTLAGEGTWVVSIWQGDTEVYATPDATTYAASQRFTDISEFTIPVGPFSATGSTLTVKIDPWFAVDDGPNAIYYDSVDFPSRLELGGGNVADTEPPTAPTGLVVGNATAASLGLNWTAATDNVGVDHYKIYRTDADPENPYDDATFASIGTTVGTSYVDTGLVPETTYSYKVSALDAAGNEGPPSSAASGTTLEPDTTPPILLTVAVVAGSSVAEFSWTTDEATTGLLEYGLTTSYGTTATTVRALSHTTVASGLALGTTYYFRITASDDSANTAVEAGSFTTDSDLAYWLHRTSTGTTPNVVTTLWMDELNATGDVDGGYNPIGAVFATTDTVTGVPLLGPVDDYPVDPSHAGVLLDAAEPVTGRVYVRLGAGSPTGVGLLDLNLTVLAGSTVVAAGTVSQLVTSSGFVPFDFSLPVQAALVPADTLHAVVRAESGTNQYIFGYEGDHASRIALSPLTTGPLTAVATFVGSGAPVEDVALAFDATVAGGIAPFSFAWDFNGEGTSTDEDPSFAFPTAGLKTVTLTVTDAASNVGVSTLLVRVRQTDFVGAPRVVVALADSGINPYHETYRRPGIQLPLDELANASDGALPREIELTFGADHAANVAADAADWAGIGERELVWFKDTNVLGISIGTLAQVGGTRVLDDPSGGATGDAGGHGTATSDTVLDAWPDAIVVMVENSNGIPDDGIPEAFKWAIAQPWIDVISGSLGMPANVPEPIFLMQVAALQRDAWASGKLWVESAGNDPSFLPTDSLDGSPWVISVTGSQEGGEAKEINSGYLYADVASNFTVEAARYDSVDADASISGTSFSCPTVAGTLAGAIHELRRASGWTGGIEAGELVPPTDVANADLRNAMNKTALYHPFEGYLFGIHSGGDHGLTPLAPWTQVGWGHVDGTFVEDIVDVVSSADYALPAPPAEKGLAKIYMDVVAAERAAIWSTWVSAEEGNDVTGPGATVANGPVGTVQSVATIETPHPYAPDTEQAWTITVPGASAIQIHFEEFETETAFDFVFLEDLDGNVLAVYQGPASTIDLVVDDASAGPLDFWTVPVPGDTVVVHFTSDSFAEFHGFRIDEVAAT